MKFAIINTTFISNQAVRNDGAIYCTSNNTGVSPLTMIIIKAYFQFNSAANGGSTYLLSCYFKVLNSKE